MNKHSSNSSEGCVLEVDLEYPKELCQWHNYYPLAPYKIQIKKEIVPNFRLKIADLCNIPTGNIKKVVPNFFDAEKYVLYYKNLQLYLRLVLKLKKHFYKNVLLSKWYPHKNISSKN